MPGVEGEMVVGEDKLSKLDKELSGWYGVGSLLVKEVFQGRETMEMGDVGVEGSDINSCHNGVDGERLNNHKEVIGVFNI
jgi:hypothetical protein